jgi:tetratricopeptide (TPR) repeat protein
MQRSHEINPHDENALTNLGYLYLLTGRREEALALLDPEMKRRLALYAEKKDEKVLPHMELLVVYAWAVHEAGRHEEALHLLSAVHPEGPEDLGAHFVAAVCWLMLDRQNEFRQCFRIAMTKYFIDTWEQLMLPFIHRVGAWMKA